MQILVNKKLQKTRFLRNISKIERYLLSRIFKLSSKCLEKILRNLCSDKV